MYFEQNLSTKAFALDLRNRSLNYTQYMANKLTKLEINYDQFYIINKLFNMNLFDYCLHGFLVYFYDTYCHKYV